MEQRIKNLLSFEDLAREALEQQWLPFLEHTPFTTFTYLQFFDNGTFTNLCSAKSWSNVFYPMETIDLHYLKQIQIARESNTYHLYFWPLIPSEGKITSLLHSLGIGKGFTIFKYDGHKVHGWGLTSLAPDNELMNYYWRNQKELLAFFRHLAAEHEKFCRSQQDIILAANMNSDQKEKESLEYKDIQDFYTPKGNNLRLFTKNGSENVSYKMWEVLELFATGNSLKQIAYALNISVKTVEQRLTKLRGILSIYSRDQLFDIWKQNAG